MNEMENLVLDEGTENVEATTTEEIVEQVAEPEKVYTEEEFNNKLNDVSGKRAARKEAKLRKEYERKYGGLIDVLVAGTGIKDVEELTNTFKEHYSQRGVQFAEKPTYTDSDIKVLAKAEADDIIKLGFEEAVEEADRLSEIGAVNMSPREKALFVELNEYINNTKTSRELKEIGVSADVYESKEFKEFASQFNSNTPITQIYKIYNQTQPKKQIKPMGSIKNTTVNNGVKDYYSPEDIARLTEDDLANPDVWNAVRRSMTSG
jgi:hypothetical protein